MCRSWLALFLAVAAACSAPDRACLEAFATRAETPAPAAAPVVVAVPDRTLSGDDRGVRVAAGKRRIPYRTALAHCARYRKAPALAWEQFGLDDPEVVYTFICL